MDYVSSIIEILNSPHVQRELHVLAREIKHKLSETDTTTFNIQEQTATLTRTEMNTLFEPLIQKTLRACRRALRDAKTEHAISTKLSWLVVAPVHLMFVKK